MTTKIEVTPKGRIEIVRANRQRLTTGDLERLARLHDWHKGACKCSEWTTGSGKWVTLQKLPPFAEKITIEDGIERGGWVGRTCRRMQRESPRLQYVIAITDLRKARQVLKIANAD